MKKVLNPETYIQILMGVICLELNAIQLILMAMPILLDVGFIFGDSTIF